MGKADDMRLTFWNGTHTVGGVQVMLRCDASALLFDFGFTPNWRASLFNRYVPLPAEGRLRRYLSAGMAPLVEGVYADEHLSESVASAVAPLRREGCILADLPVLGETEPGRLGIFVSHLHQDHMALLPYVSPQVPVYMSQEGAVFHEALVQAGALPPTRAEIQGLADGEEVAVGDLRIQLCDMDHDIPGAAGFIAQTSAGTVAWTGDWRLHGRHTDRLSRFAERCQDRGVDLLITEGTSLRPGPDAAGHDRQIPEVDVAERIDDVLERTKGLASAAFYPRNLERIADIRSIAGRHGRELVLSRETAEGWLGAVKNGVQAGDPWGVYVLEEAGGKVEAEADERFRTVTVQEIRADRSAFFCEVQIEHRSLLLDTCAQPEDVYFHTNGNPLGQSGPEWETLETWIRQLNIDMHWLNSGGHAPPDGLAWLVDAADPDMVIPVHSSYPELYPSRGARRYLPRRGETLALRF
jgi:mRNA degradation ribonuclease J1/J2